ncbi:MAG: Hsp70 family protein, partial [Dehalococcoidia bacterium]
GENKTIGRFLLDGILPAPRGVPQVEVAFDMDADGILNVSAKDKGTGKEQKITITASSGLDKGEVERMVREAEAHAEEDRQKREEVEARNNADALAYNAEKTIREHGDKIPEELKSEIEGKVAAVRSALQAGDVPQIRSATEELQQAVQKVGTAIYQQTGTEEGPTDGEAPPEQGGPTDGQGPDQPGDDDSGSSEDTVEGEFREVN